MADNKQKWHEATTEILKRLDVAAEYRALAVDVCGHKPSSKGWLECRSFGIEDRTPSAGINVGDGPLRARYKDFRGESMGLFDFAATVAGKFPTWKDARQHYASTTGVKLPGGDEELLADRISPTTLEVGQCLIYASQKPGVSGMSIKECGGQYALWPKKLAPEKTNHVIAFPMYGAMLTELEPTGWHIVSANPRFKIRKWRGKGNEPELVDKLTLGEYGLMNVDGLQRLAEATVVNIVEGITDLLACQAVLSDWRKADLDGRKHVVLSAGACTYHPRTEWMHHFAGKEVRLWFDVGDKGNEGQNAAGVWVKALLPVTDRIRNIQLPLGADGGKNDIRAWLVNNPDANLPARNYADMCEYAEMFPYLDPETKEAQVSASEAVTAALGLTVIGEYEGKNMIEVYSDTKQKGGTIMDINKLTVPTLVQLLGAEAVERSVYEGKDDCPPGKYDLKTIKYAIANEASSKTFYGDEKFGAGVWEHDGQLVLVKAKEVGLLNGSGKIEQSFVPFVNGRILDCGRGSGEWYDLDVLNRYLALAQDHNWCMGVIEEAYRVFSLWNWRQAKDAPTMLTGLVICSWLQSIWTWRPQVFVTGNSNTGKTMLLQETIAGGIFGPLGMFVEKPTEAAISQHMKHHSKVVFVDEFEKDAHRQRILELFRTTSRGGSKIRGTADHKGVTFRLRHIPWLSSIETGLTREADKNRYIILELDTITPEKEKAFKPPSQPEAAELGMQLLAIGLAHYQRARTLAKTIQGAKVAGVPSRCVESFALPVAMLAAAGGFDDQTAKNFLANTLAGWDFDFQASADHINCLSAILTATVDLRAGEKRNVSTLLKETYAGETKMALDRIGVKKVRKYNALHPDEFEFALWICTDVIGRTLLRNTAFEGHSVDQYLMRLPGAKRSQQRLGGDERFRGIEILMSEVWSIFKADADENQQDTENGEF